MSPPPPPSGTVPPSQYPEGGGTIYPHQSTDQSSKIPRRFYAKNRNQNTDPPTLSGIKYGISMLCLVLIYIPRRSLIISNYNSCWKSEKKRRTRNIKVTVNVIFRVNLCISIHIIYINNTKPLQRTQYYCHRSLAC